MYKKEKAFAICREFPSLNIETLQKKYEEKYGETICEPTIRDARNTVRYTQQAEEKSNGIPTLGMIVGKAMSTSNIDSWDDIMTTVSWCKKLDGPQPTDIKLVMRNSKNKTYLLEWSYDGHLNKAKISERIAILLSQLDLFERVLQETQSNPETLEVVDQQTIETIVE